MGIAGPQLVAALEHNLDIKAGMLDDMRALPKPYASGKIEDLQRRCDWFRNCGLVDDHDILAARRITISAICPTIFNAAVTYYRRFDLALRAAYRASLAALRSVCKASSRLAASARARSACVSAARFASIASSAS